MKTVKKIVIGLFALLSLASGPVLAESEAPDVLIKRISQEILDLAHVLAHCHPGDHGRQQVQADDAAVYCPVEVCQGTLLLAGVGI